MFNAFRSIRNASATVNCQLSTINYQLFPGLAGKAAAPLQPSGYGVIATLMKRVAAADALQPQPAALPDAVFADRLQHILGAAGDIDTAGRAQG